MVSSLFTIKQANGVFQWVHIIMPTIQQKILRRQSPKDIRKWSRTVPSELEEMYLDTLERVMTIENPQEVFLFFQWLNFLLDGRHDDMHPLKHAICLLDQYVCQPLPFLLGAQRA
jgi:hypothetical protein